MKVHGKIQLGVTLVVLAAGATIASCSANEDSGGAAGRAGSGQSGSAGKGATGSGGFGASGGAVASGGFGGTGVTGGASGSGGVNGSGGAGGSFGVGGSATNDGAPVDADFGYDAPETSADACASETARAEEVPLDIYVMYDQSTSMTCPAGAASRWNVITPAFQSFLSSPQAAGIGVGIQYFGQGSECNALSYFIPDVPIAPLPGNLGALNLSLQAHGTIGINLTTTNAALLGAIDQAKDWKLKHTTHAVVVLLVTDGQPNACGSVQNVVTTATNGRNGNPSILTFVLGIVAGSGSCPFDPNPPNVNDLNTVAQAGGTQQAYVVDPGSNNAAQQLLNALDQIRGLAALPCQYLIPKPSGGFADTKQITVTYTPGGGSQQTVPKVANQAACNASGGGWYFDNNANPTAIILCPVTCNVVKSDVNASVDVTVGCIKG